MDAKAQKTKIIIIDDEKDMVELIKERLIANDFSVICAYDGLSGLEMINREKPDLVILDLMMPKMDGRDVLVLLKKDPATKNIPIVILTCKTEQFERDYGLELGADKYIEKPYEPSILLMEIKDMLRKKKGP